MKRFIFLLTTIFICTIAYAENITINWGVDNQPYTTTTCEIGGDVTLPNTPTKRGHVFRGWTAEHVNRGTWLTWSNVPTDTNLYPSDYHGSRIPTASDYMVVEDSSGYVPDLDIELFIPQTGTRAFTLGGEQKKVPDYPNEVSWELPDITITASFHSDWRSYFTANKTVKCGNVIYAPGETFATVMYYGNPGPTIYYSNGESLSGAWRFSYRGIWATDNISGWKPDVQISNE